MTARMEMTCNGFAEDEETGDAGDAGAAVEEDEECGSAMLGYLEARQKWMALRKARGFREPSDQGHAKNNPASIVERCPQGIRMATATASPDPR